MKALPLAALPLFIWPLLPAPAATYEAPLDERRAAAVAFADAPRAAPAGDQVRIAFAASAATDVEVAVLNAQGRVVRHLAAGLLGPHAPAPLQPDTLQQSLLCDRRDDAGQPAAAPPFQVRVRLGLGFGAPRWLGWVGDTGDPIGGLAVGKGGEVYVLTHSWVGQGRRELRVLDRRGAYLRTIMPYPATTPAERARSVGQIELDGQRLPLVFSGHAHSLHPLTAGLPAQQMAWNPRGYLVAVSTLATSYEHGLPRHLLAFDPRGGAPAGVNFVGPEIRPPTGITWGHGEGDDPCFEHVAASPDGRWIYYAGSTFQSAHAVYRLAWDEAHGAGMEAGWFGQDNRPGSDDRHLNDPQGLAVDAQGRVYICDRGNNRVVIVPPDGLAAGSFPVESPDQIAVHPGTGVIYLSCRQAPPGTQPKDTGPMPMTEYKAWRAREAARRERRPPPLSPRLLKFAAWNAAPPRELARQDGAVEWLSLDAEAAPPRLWTVAGGKLLPLDDRGDHFEAGAPVLRGEGLSHPAYVMADPERNRVLLYQLSANYKIQTIDLDTGKRSLLLQGVSDLAIAPDGSLYGTGKFDSNELLRFASDGKPLPFAGTDQPAVKIAPLWVGGINLGARGLAVSPGGDIYVLRASGEKGVQSRVDVYGPDGRLKRAALVDGMGTGDCGIGADAAGNVYVGVNVRPAAQPLPRELAGKVPAANWLCWAQGTWGERPPPWHYSMRNEYLYHGGAVMKFGPAGGAFYGRGSLEYTQRQGAAAVVSVTNAPADATAYMSGYLHSQVKVSGAQWRYAGMSIVPSSERQWGDPSCVCMTSRLSVDPYGRVYVPDVFCFRVAVLDANGNRLACLGRYGNADDDPREAHFAWPAFVSAREDLLCVSDSVNKRIAAVRLAAAAEKTCPLP